MWVEEQQWTVSVDSWPVKKCHLLDTILSELLKWSVHANMMSASHSSHKQQQELTAFSLQITLTDSYHFLCLRNPCLAAEIIPFYHLESERMWMHVRQNESCQVCSPTAGTRALVRSHLRHITTEELLWELIHPMKHRAGAAKTSCYLSEASCLMSTCSIQMITHITIQKSEISTIVLMFWMKTLMFIKAAFTW